MAATVGSRGQGTPTRSGIGVSPSDWRVQLLTRLGAPVTWPNLDALQAWALSESGYNSSYGTNLAGPLAFNPLAITDSYGVPTVGDVNSAGVKAFGSTAAGVDATAIFLEHGYQPVIQALKDSNPKALFSAVNQSGWCSGCEGGQYPVALASWLGGSSFPGEHGGFHGTAGSTPAAAASQAAAQTLQHDSGGLFGTCGGGTSVPLLPFSLPPFGCYVLNSVEFAVPAIGGAIMMLVGAYFVVSPSLRRSILQLPAGAGGVVGAVAGQVQQQAGRVAAQRPAARRERREATEAERARAAASEKERRSVERSRGRQARARARKAEAEARAAERSAPTNRQRIAAAGRGRVLEFEAPGVPRIGGRPDRMQG